MSIGFIASQKIQTTLNVGDYLNKRISAIVSPKSAEGISGWVFDIPKSEQVKISNDITDHYMEDNSFINDHVVRKPIEITLSGLIGELVYKKPSGFGADLSFLSGSLSTIDSYMGDYSPQQLQKQQNLLGEIQKNYNFTNQIVQKTSNMIKAFAGDGQEKTLQELAYNDLLSLMEKNQLLKVQTPFAYFESMLIRDITFVQEEDSDSYSDISITLKEMRFAEISITKFDKNLIPPRNQQQEESETDNGNIKGDDSDLLADITGEEME
jgi:hypothetical protein